MMKKIEIALLIDQDGRWSAAGSSNMDAKVSREVVSDELFHDPLSKQADEVNHRYHIIEVDVPIPEASDTKIEGHLRS